MTGSMRITAGDCRSPGHSKTSAEAVSDEFDRARCVLNGTFKPVSHGCELGFQGVVDHLGFFLPGSLGHGGLGFGRFFHRFFGSRKKAKVVNDTLETQLTPGTDRFKGSV